MNGRELEHLLAGIDENILRGRVSLRNEILHYLRDHEVAVLEALRTSDRVMVPTSSGLVQIDLSELQALVA
jgi:hypothetical protein